MANKAANMHASVQALQARNTSAYHIYALNILKRGFIRCLQTLQMVMGTHKARSYLLGVMKGFNSIQNDITLMPF